MTPVQNELDFDLGTETVRCTTDEVAAAFAGLLREMRNAAPFVAPHERQVLRRIMAHDSGTLTVADVFPDFDRDSDALTVLRRLRTAQFIRPLDRDRWEAEEHIEIKPFARIVWDRLGEAGIFGDAAEEERPVQEEEAVAPAPPAEPPVPNQPATDEVDLSLPDGDEPDEHDDDVLLSRANRKGRWDEADVLEFLNDDTPPTLKSQAG